MATSPFCNQSKSRPMVLSCLATYPSSDMIACACTVPINPLLSAALGSVALHHDTVGERRGLDQPQVSGLREPVEQGLPLAEHQRLDEQAILVDQILRCQRAGKTTAAPHDDVWAG